MIGFLALLISKRTIVYYLMLITNDKGRRWGFRRGEDNRHLQDLIEQSKQYVETAAISMIRDRWT